MKHLNSLIITVIFMVCWQMTAQQDPYYTLYRYNMNLINPAYAGSRDQMELGLNFRDQWANIDGAPESQALFFSAPMGNNLGLGTSISNDKTFIEKQTSLKVDFSYKVRLDQDNVLYLGLKTGFDSYNVNTAGLTTYGISSDPSLTNLDNTFKLNVGVGAYLKNEDYFLSLSIPKILQSNRLQNDNGTARLNKERIHVYLAGGYNFYLTENIVYKPSILARYVPASPFSLDFTNLFEFSEQIELGAGYRFNESFSGIFILKAIEWMDIGYAYEVPLQSAIRTIDSGTHEIMAYLKF